MKNKLILLIIVVFILLFIISIFIAIKKNQNDIIIKKESVDFTTAFEIENINDSKYKIETGNGIKLSTKYVALNNIYILDADVKLGNRTGEVIYIRDDKQKLNIYKTKYRIDELDFNNQIERYIEMFINECTNYIGTEEKPTSEIIYGNSKNNLPVSESIYLENRLYSLTYKLKDDAEQLETNENQSQVFDVNFYRDGNYLICEFVKQL